MKKIIAITALIAGLASCGSGENANTNSADSTQMQVPSDDKKVTQGSIQLPPETNGATGTTLTGTVADSANAAHPGSDTSYHIIKKR